MGLYKRGKKWYGSIVDANGRLLRKALSVDKRVAERIFAKLREDIELQKAGVLPALPEAKEDKPLNVIHREFLDHMKMRGRSESYFHAFDVMFRQVVLRRGITSIRDITTDLLTDWVRGKRASGLKGQSINQMVSTFRGFLIWAVKAGYLDRDPLVAWEPVRASDKLPRRDLSLEEVRAILKTEPDSEYRLRWLVYFTTALRKRAGASLSWEWVDWQDKMIILPIEDNKSRRINRIPMHPELFDALQARHKALGEPKQGRVFPPVGLERLLRRFRVACRLAGLNMEGVCLHSVRHTVATMLYEASGRNLKAVQEVLGHSNISTTAGYLHVEDEMKRAAVESLKISLG